MTRHADHAAKIIAAARIRSRESGRRGARMIIWRTAGMAKPATTKAHPASGYRS